MRAALAGAGVVVAAAVAAAAFVPVFTAGALLWPVIAVLSPVLAADQLAVRWPRLAPVRPLLGAGAGLLALTIALDGPFAQAVRALPAAATHGWLRTLESTWPVRPEPVLVGFVALAVLAAAVLGVELVRRVPAPWALLPSLAVLGLSQVYHAAGGWGAVGIAVGYGTAAAAVLAFAERPADGNPAAVAPARSGATSRARWWVPVAVAVPAVLAVAVGAWASAALDPLGRPAYSPHERHQLAELPAAVTNPLHEIADRLSHPNDVVFVNRTAAPVDRWPVAVLDAFDGVNWTSDARFRPMGGMLAAEPVIIAAAAQHEAAVTIQRLSGPWLPTQFRLRQVDGIDVLVDPATGSMLTTSGTSPLTYQVRWQAPEVTAEVLAGAPVDTELAGSPSLGQVPSAVVDLAREATEGAPPSFRTALVLEGWLRDHYKVATGDTLPTGHGYAQLQHFLSTGKRGTSEQFATAYVVMARSVGIPARLVVGFRQPDADAAGNHVVRNADVLVWPEVAVRGVGWIPLDPTAGASAASSADRSLAAATEKVRKSLPDSGQLESGELPPVPQPEPPPPPPVPGSAWWPLAVGALLAALAIGWLSGVPLLKRVRGSRRRAATPEAAVIGAWREARDRLREHGVAARLGMTVRDLRLVSQPLLGNSADSGLDRLARCVDHTLWSGLPVDQKMASEAWSGVDAVRGSLASRPWPARLRAQLDPRSLLFPRR